MSDIPSDVYRQILRRVPADSLFRFRSVCKEWCRIIDDPVFVKTHLHRPQIGDTEHLHLFIRTSTGKNYSLPLTSFADSQFSTRNKIRAANIKNIVGRVPRLRELPVASCDGLILIPACKKSMVWLIWNPFTGESLELPLCDDFVNLKEGDMPCNGIGYDAVNDDYKIVRIVSGFDDNFGRKLVTYIYSMNSNTWRRIDDFHKCFIWDFDGTGVFRNGTLYWIADEMLVPCILALDLTTETFRKIPLPLAPVESKKCSLQLDVLDGHLFLSCSYEAQDFVLERFQLWMIKDYGSENEWSRILSFREKVWSVRGGTIRPVAYFKNKELVLIQKFNEKFAWCDVKNQCLRSIKILGLPDTFSSQVFPASLVQLKGSEDSTYNEGFDSKGTLKRKRNSSDDRLNLKIKSSYSPRCNLSS